MWILFNHCIKTSGYGMTANDGTLEFKNKFVETPLKLCFCKNWSISIWRNIFTSHLHKMYSYSIIRHWSFPSINKADIKWLDFMVNRFLYKLFRTGNPDIIENCRSFFNLKLPSEIIHHRVKRFTSKISYIDNILCKIFNKFLYVLFICTFSISLYFYRLRWIKFYI